MGKKLGIKSVTIRSTGGEGARTGFIEKVKMKKNGKISALKKDGKKLLYGNDTGWFPDETWRFLEREGHLDGVSLDCTMGRQKEGTNHMGIPDNREVIKRLKLYGCVDSDTKIVITHFFHHGGFLYEELEQEVGTDGWYVAYDGFCLEI